MTKRATRGSEIREARRSRLSSLPAGVALVCVWLAHVTAVAQAPEPVIPEATLQEARERIARAETLFGAEDFEGALVEFERIYELLENHPIRDRSLYNMARCYERLFRYQEAMTYYQRYLDAAAPDALNRGEAQAKAAALESLLATVRLTVNVESYEVWVGDRHVGDDLELVLVPGGEHVLEIRAPGHLPSQQEVQLPSGALRTLGFELEALAAPYRGLDPLVFSLMAGGAGLTAALGLVFGGLALYERGQIDSRHARLGTWTTSSQDRAQVDQMETWALISDVFFGAGLLLAVTSVVLAVETDWGEAGDDAPRSVGLVPLLGPTTAGLAAMGAF